MSHSSAALRPVTERSSDGVIHPVFAAFVADDGFPCVGAKSALSHDAIATLCVGDLRDGAGDIRVLQALRAFAARVDDDAVFVSMAVIFETTPRLSETAFETALWQRLQALHDLDAADHRWDPAVSSDPQAPDFSMSLGGRAFYVIGLHPGASRVARRFSQAALVFNLHSQFEQLRADGRYAKLRDAIGERDVALCGSRNPMLANHGERSEAPQYSGRMVGSDWACPFRVQGNTGVVADATARGDAPR